MKSFRDPGHAFVANHGPLRDPADIVAYADYLRHESGVGDNPPIDLSEIWRCFGIPTPKVAPLQDQQGILLCRKRGIILIKEDDISTRQRFTLAHELVEFLFAAHDDAVGVMALGDWWRTDKEACCNQGAAELLMPDSSFLPRLASLGVSLDSASKLAAEYDTSLSSTLLKMILRGQGKHLLIVWHHVIDKLFSKKRDAGQVSLFGGDPSLEPQADLRVNWCAKSPIVIDYSRRDSHPPSPGSVIRRVYENGGMEIALEPFRFLTSTLDCIVEAKQVEFGSERCVISLHHLPGDDDCPTRNSISCLQYRDRIYK